jgi:hypothetical protein
MIHTLKLSIFVALVLVGTAISIGAANISVKISSERGLPVGSSKSFIHQITISGTPLLANQVIGIDDPVGRVCTTVKTNAFGIATYSCRPGASLKPGFYALAFMFGNQRLVSTVVVTASISGKIVSLPQFKVPVGVISQSDPNFTVMPGTYRMKDYSTPTTRAINDAVDFGTAVLLDYLSNPGNVGIFVVTAIVCSGGQVVPVAGQVSCAAGLEAVGVGLAVSTGKLAAKNYIKGSKMSAADQNKWNQIVDATACAISITRFDPNSGLEAFQIVSKSWTAGSTTYKLLNSAQGEGLSLAGVAPGTKGEIVQISIYKKKG